MIRKVGVLALLIACLTLSACRNTVTNEETTGPVQTTPFVREEATTPTESNTSETETPATEPVETEPEGSLPPNMTDKA